MTRKMKKPIAWLLMLAVLLSYIPAFGQPAQAATVTVQASDAEDFREKYRTLPNGGEIQLTGDIELDTPLYLERDIQFTISSKGAEREITNNGRLFTENAVPPGTELYNSLIYLTAGSVTITKNVTLNPRTKGRSIQVSGTGASLHLSGCKIINGSLKQSQSGAGVYAYGAGLITIDGGTLFQKNKLETGSACGGGALYVSGAGAVIKDALFLDNTAHSGGAIYVYGTTVTCSAETYFVGNTAGQRGGAIHDHGTVVLNGTQLDGQVEIPSSYNVVVTNPKNKSGQYGGGVYVSADGTTNGALVLNGAVIQNNEAGNSGGGVFVTDKGTLYVGNGATVSGNELSDAQVVPEEYRANNVFVSTSDSKMIAFSKVGAIGISTANPYYPKIVVRSTSTESSDLPSGVTAGYTLTGEADISAFTYDSAVWLIKDATKDKTAVNTNPDCKTGNLWLGLNPTYPGGGGSSGSNEVIFDFNVPGQAAVVLSGNPGETKPHPSISNITQGEVTYKFLGWFDAPVGGSPAPNPVTIQSSSKVYYAQWKVEVTGGGGSETGKGDMRLVYFDQNITGGGVTAAYVTSGQFTFTVEFEWKDPTKPDSKPITKYDTVTVSIPFGFPGDPYRTGYIFKGWGTTASTASMGVTYDAAYGTLPTPTRDGYAFDGWFTAKQGGTEITAETTVKITANQILYARWTANTDTPYKVEYWRQNVDGKGYTKHETENLTATTDTTVTAEVKEYEGFSEDSANTGRVPSGQVAGNGSTVLKLYYTRHTHTLTVDRANGTAVETETVYYGANRVLPADPARKGYTFEGWNVEGVEMEGKKYAMPDNNVIITAIWQAIDYSVTYKYTGTVPQGAPALPDGGKNHNIGDVLEVAPAPTLDGYVLYGWLTKDVSIKDGKFTMPDGNVTFTGEWRTANYNVVYVYQGNVPDKAPKPPVDGAVHQVGDTVSMLSAPEFPGYEFSGWTASVQVNDDGEFTMPVGNVIFRGSWSPLTYSADFTYSGEAPDNAPQFPDLSGYKVGDMVAVPSVDPIEGYTFGGWQLNGEPIVGGAFPMPVGGATVVGVWVRNTYAVTYTYTGYVPKDVPNAPIMSKRYHMGDSVTVAAVPAAKGYTCSTWTTAEAAVANGSFTMPGHDVGFTAAWTVNSYSIKYEFNGGTAGGTDKSAYTVETPSFTFSTPTRDGFTFGGWYADAGFTTSITGVTLGSTGDLTVYAKWTEKQKPVPPSGGGGGGGGGGGPVIPPTPEQPLNKTDHIAYIKGFGDGTVRPMAQITRAEVAQIFYRLLTDDARKKYGTTSNSFTDSNVGDWYNEAVSTLAAMPFSIAACGKSYAELYELLKLPPPPKKKRNGQITYAEAYQRSKRPYHLVAFSEAGATQLALMRRKDHRQKVANLILGKQWAPAPRDVPEADGVADGIPITIGIDMNLRRITGACQTARERGYPMIRVAALTSQVDEVLAKLLPLDGVEILYFEPEDLETAFEGSLLHTPVHAEYRGPGGRGLLV